MNRKTSTIDGLYFGLDEKSALPIAQVDSAHNKSLKPTPAYSFLINPSSTAWTSSAVVNRIPRRGGIGYHYSYGGQQRPLAFPYPGAASGQVHRSAFQTWATHMWDWTTNASWFAAGYPRNLGLSFRVPQIATQKTGGPGPSEYRPRGLWTRVQRVQRASATPKFFNTTSK